MNDNVRSQPARPIAELNALLRPRMHDYVKTLRSNVLPAKTDLQSMQLLFDEYLARLRYEQSEEEAFGSVQFNDISGESMDDTSIIAELSGITDAGMYLADFAFRKLIAVNDPVVTNSSAELLIQKGYVAPAVIHAPFNSGTFYTLTSKGMLCFSRKKLQQKLCRSHGFMAVPTALCLKPKEWNNHLMCKALLLHQYYNKQCVHDYILFTAQSDNDTLLGCEVSESSEICYTYAWVENPVQEENPHSVLCELANNSSVSNIIIVFTTKSVSDKVNTYISHLNAINTIHPYCLEVDTNE